MILLSLTANVIVVALISKKYSIARKEIICLLIYENIGIIIGAKIVNFLLNYNRLGGRFDFSSLGFAAYGAAIGAILSLVLFGLKFNIALDEILYIFMPSMSLMYGIGKIGCFFTGCCHGIRYDGLGSVVYNYSNSAPENVRLFPIQIIEALLFFIIFVYMIIQTNKKHFNLNTVGVSIVLCGSSKFLLEYLRASHRGMFISANQIISLVCFCIGMIFCIKYKGDNV